MNITDPENADKDGFGSESEQTWMTRRFRVQEFEILSVDKTPLVEKPIITVFRRTSGDSKVNPNKARFEPYDGPLGPIVSREKPERTDPAET